MLSKNDLRNAIASKNRGLSATENDRAMIASIIARVEDLNPTPDPLSAPQLLAGDWRLLYTTSQELLGIDRFPLAQLGDIYQCVRPKESKIYNIAELNSLPYCEALVSVVANFEPAQEINREPAQEMNTEPAQEMNTEPAEDGYNGSNRLSSRRVNVRFTRGVVGLQRALGYQSAAQHVAKLETTEKLGLLQGLDFAINSDRQQGWLEVTYLDEDLRIGRGNQGSLFVLTK
ncbi:MAG: PAP/fibrillin family protein [Phormidesmis sp.]